MKSTEGRKTRTLSIGVALAVALAMTGCAQTDAPNSGGVEEEYNWRFVSFLADNTSTGKASQWWMDEVEDRSDGRITFDAYFGNTLMPPDEIFPALADGRIDVGWGVHSYTGEAFPYAEIGTIPFQTKNGAAATAAMNELYAESPDFQAEWSSRGLRPLAFVSSSPHVTGTTTPTESWEDYAGLRIRALDYAAVAFETSDANVVALPVAELYESLQRGLVDGYGTLWFDLVGSLRLVEQAKYLTDNGIGIYGVQELLMAGSAWEELPEDLRSIIDEVNAELPAKVAEIYAEADVAACEVMKEEGAELTVWSDAKVDDWRDQVEDAVLEQWKSRLGDDDAADDLLSTYREAVDKYEDVYSDVTPGIVTCAEEMAG